MFEHYIYLYRDPRNGRPFYIGKGKGLRYQNHYKEATARKSKRDKNSHKINLIKQIYADGFDPVIEFIIKNISEETANLLEKKYISLYGRADLNEGPLTNLTEGGDGQVGWSPDRRKSHSERKEALILVKDFEGNTFTVANNDPRWISGELVGINKGKKGVTNSNGRMDGYILAKDSEGNRYRVKRDDPRWISGELVGINKGVTPNENVINAAKARKGFKRSAESIELGASKLRGKEKSEDHRNKLSEAVKNLPKTLCPHCNKLFSPGGYSKHKKSLN